MYKSILVPLDGSKRAERILPHVEQLARSSNAQVVLLQVVESNHYAYESNKQFVELDIKLAKQQVDEATRYLDTIRGEFRDKSFKVRSMVLSGSVVRNIIRVAETENVDMIAMASHGRTGLSSVFYGSVAAGILQRVDRPLLLIRAGED